MCFRPASIDAPVPCPNCGKAYPVAEAMQMTECPNCGFNMSDVRAGTPSVPAPPGAPGAPKAPGAPAAPKAPGPPPAPRAPGA